MTLPKWISICAFAVTLIACAPEVGTPRWCEAMDEKPKGDWTPNEAGDYVRHCVFTDSGDPES
jgi:hypothetical protein